MKNNIINTMIEIWNINEDGFTRPHAIWINGLVKRLYRSESDKKEFAYHLYHKG